MKYTQWLTNPVRFIAMTGYSIEKFEELLPHFSALHDTYLSRYDVHGKLRSGIRKYVLYANSPLPTHAERLCFILSYLKLNPLQEHHADTFSMQQKQCNEFVHVLKTILDKTLHSLSVMPASTDKELQVILDTITTEADKNLLHDATEREIPRPQNKDIQKEYYSGKKKINAVKNAAIVTMTCMVLYLSITVSSRIHDKKIADTHYSFKKGFTAWQDTGYQGYAPEGVIIMQPIKKPKGKELTEEQKAYNLSVSRVRVRVEHAFGSIKRYHIVKDECRLRKNQFVESILHTCAALHNFRIRDKPFQYPEYVPVNKPT